MSYVITTIEAVELAKAALENAERERAEFARREAEALTCPKCKTLEAKLEAYREAGARLLQAFQGRFCMAADDMEDCLKTVDMEAEIILNGGE